MEDDNIKQLLSNFNPLLSSSSQFMTKLEKNLLAVEFLKQHNQAVKRRNKIAVAIAAASGFVAGIILTLLYPLIVNWIATFNLSITNIEISLGSFDFSILAMFILAAASITIALNVYEIASAKLSAKSSPMN